jgi:hypothetical protein
MRVKAARTKMSTVSEAGAVGQRSIASILIALRIKVADLRIQPVDTHKKSSEYSNALEIPGEAC